MAVPSDLTVTNIVTEAFYKSGISSPLPTQITRAGSYFLREVLNDIWTSRDEQDNPVKFKLFRAVSTQITTIGISKYSLPSDFDDEISISFLNGSHTGTAQAGANTTITLEDEEDATEGDVEGKYILLTGGTGSTGLRQATDYNTTTYIATVNTVWTTNPDATSTYRIIDIVTDLTEDSTIGFGAMGLSRTKGTPSQYARISESGTDYILLDKPPDASTYGLMTRYYVNPNKVDLTASIMTRIYNDWQSLLTYGVASKICEDQELSQFEVFFQEYQKLLRDVIAKETPSSGEFEGFTL